MKKKLHLIVACLILGIISVNAQNPVPNFGFESWSGGSPNQWLTNNNILVTPITQTTPAYSGSLALKGEVLTYSSNAFPPLLFSSDINGNGFPVSETYGSLNFYYKFNKIGHAYITALGAIYDDNSNAVEAAAANFGTNTTSYTYATVPFVYISGSPSECVISFTIADSAGDPAVGNYFVIDEVSLSGNVGIPQLPAGVAIQQVNPNPIDGEGFIYYSLNGNSSDVTFEIMDMAGRSYMKIAVPGETTGRHKIDFDASSLPSGYYLVNMRADAGIASMPMVVSH